MPTNQPIQLICGFAVIAVSTVMLANASTVVDESRPVAPQDQANAREPYEGGAAVVGASALACNLDPAVWLDPIPHVFEVCFASDNYQPNEIGVLPLGAADVNGDGLTEFFDWRRSNGDGGILLYQAGGFSYPGAILYRSTTEVAPNSTRLVRDQVLALSATDIQTLRQVLGPNLSYMSAVPRGWRDVDLDRDLDLVVSVTISYSGLSGYWQKEVWFENSGNEYTPPCSADLNRDGQVNGEDLCLVLACWTGAE